MGENILHCQCPLRAVENEFIPLVKRENRRDLVSAPKRVMIFAANPVPEGAAMIPTSYRIMDERKEVEQRSLSFYLGLRNASLMCRGEISRTV